MNELLLNNNHINYNIENLFWHFVDDANWYNLSKTNQENAIDNIMDLLIRNYSIDEIISLQQEEIKHRCEIEDIINEYLDNLSDEKRNEYKLDNMETIDLASHIVGLGRTMFNYIKDNPQIIFNLQNEYLPCFGDGFDKAIYALNMAN